MGRNQMGNYAWKGGETVPIKWSAVMVSEAMDKVKHHITLAEGFIADSKAKAAEARSIANLPQYLDQRLVHLISQIERIDNIKNAIKAVRNAIPDGAIKAEQESLKYGSQQSII